MVYNNNIYFSYEKESKIFYKHYKGLIKIEDIISSWKYAFKMNLLSRQFTGIIIDYRRASFDLNIEIDSEIIAFYQENLKKFKGLRIAVVMSSVDELIVPILVSQEGKDFKSTPFICIDRARNWIVESVNSRKEESDLLCAVEF